MRELQGLKLTQQTILHQLPASVVHIKLTPSLATQVKDVRFKALMDTLNLDFPMCGDDLISDEGEFASFEFKWTWGDKKEDDSYDHFCAALGAWPTSHICAVNVSRGQRLFNSLLYTTQLWSLRKYDSKGRKIDKVAYRGEVEGRTDIVVMDRDPGSFILRHNVKYAIEVKSTADIKTPSKLASAIREATTQVLGLCGDNGNNTPPVVLTDFCTVFIVLQLNLRSAAPELKYEVLAWSCTNIKSALFKADQVSALPCISMDFGRPDTPSGSDADST